MLRNCNKRSHDPRAFDNFKNDSRTRVVSEFQILKFYLLQFASYPSHQVKPDEFQIQRMRMIYLHSASRDKAVFFLDNRI